MKIYNKKSDILRALDKDAKDTKYLDRAIERWEVLEYGGYYIIKDDMVWEVVKLLLGEVNELKKELENVSENSEEVEELKTNVEYYKNEAEEANDKVVALESVLDTLRAKGLDIWFANE